MLQVNDGQCGLCAHFGEDHSKDKNLTQIRVTHKAPESFVDACGHPKHAPLHLKVTASSTCDGFKPAHN